MIFVKKVKFFYSSSVFDPDAALSASFCGGEVYVSMFREDIEALLFIFKSVYFLL